MLVDMLRQRPSAPSNGGYHFSRRIRAVFSSPRIHLPSHVTGSSRSTPQKLGPWAETDGRHSQDTPPGHVDGLPDDDLDAAEALAMSATMQRLVGLPVASKWAEAVRSSEDRSESEATGTTMDEPSPPWAAWTAHGPATVDEALDAIRGGAPLYRLPRELRADKQVVLAAIEREGAYCFDYIADRGLRGSDRDVVMALVSADGSLLEAAAEPLRADREVVRRALRTSGEALRFASKTLQADKELRKLAGLRAKEEKRLVKRFAEGACGPVAARCM